MPHTSAPAIAASAPRFIECVEPRGKLARLLLRLLFGLAASGLLMWGLAFIVGLQNQRLLSSLFFFGFLVVAVFSWARFVELLTFVAPLFVVVPLVLHYVNYSLAELGLIGGLAALAARAAVRPCYFRSVCPLTIPLILLAAVAAISTGAMLLGGMGAFNPFLPHVLLSGIVHSIAFDQENVSHTFSATFNIIEAVVFFHLLLARVQQPGGAGRLLRILTASAVLVALTAQIQHQTGWIRDDWWRYGIYEYAVVNGTWSDPNPCSTYLLIGLTAAVGWWVTRRREPAAAAPEKRGALAWAVSKGRRFAANDGRPLLAVLIILSGAAVTFGRMANLALVLGPALCLALRFLDFSALTVAVYRWRKWLVGGGVALAVVAAVAASRLDTKDPKTMIWMVQDNPLTPIIKRRYGIWRRGLLLFSQDPWNGIGSGRLFDQMKRYHTTEVADWSLVVATWNPDRENAHSLFLQYLAELGIFGGGLFILIVGLAGFRALQAVQQGGAIADGSRGPPPADRRGRGAPEPDDRPPGGRRWAPCILAGGWLAVLGTFLTGHPLIHKELFLLYAALLALLYRPAPGDAGLWRLRRFRRRGALLAFCVLLLGCRVFCAARHPDRESFAQPTVGFHSLEWEKQRAFIWARPHNRLYFKKTTRTMRFEVDPYPACSDWPLTVTFRIGRQVFRNRFAEPGWRTFTYELPDSMVGRHHFLDIEFDHYWRPYEIGRQRAKNRDLPGAPAPPETPDSDIVNQDRRALTARFHNLFPNLNAPDEPRSGPRSTPAPGESPVPEG